MEIWKNKRWNPGLLILDHIKQLHSIISPPTTGTIWGPPNRSWRIFTSLWVKISTDSIPFDLFHTYRLQYFDATIPPVKRAWPTITVTVLSTSNFLNHHVVGCLSKWEPWRSTQTPMESRSNCNPNRRKDGSDSHHGTPSRDSSLKEMVSAKPFRSITAVRKGEESGVVGYQCYTWLPPTVQCRIIMKRNGDCLVCVYYRDPNHRWNIPLQQTWYDMSPLSCSNEWIALTLTHPLHPYREVVFFHLFHIRVL